MVEQQVRWLDGSAGGAGGQPIASLGWRRASLCCLNPPWHCPLSFHPAKGRMNVRWRQASPCLLAPTHTHHQLYAHPSPQPCQVADEHGLETGISLPQAAGAKIPAAKVSAPDQDLTQRLAELRGGK